MKQAAERINYHPDTGLFIWSNSEKNGHRIGREAGCISKIGYRVLKVEGERILAHRLAWFIHYSEEPPRMIDHVNGNKTDNRIDNLRAATHKQNMQNKKRRIDNASGCPCVYQDKRNGNWCVCIRENKKKHYFSGMESYEEAVNKYQEVAKAVFGDFFHQENINCPD